MNVQKKFEKEFKEENLKEIFYQHVIFSGATGIDNMTQAAFKKQIDQQVEIISRKMYSGSYSFSKYKLKLISKGRNKIPREISIPTVRDRVAMRGLCNFLQNLFHNSVQLKLPQDVIKDIKEKTREKKYNSYIKLDVSDFYPSIKHEELKSRLKSRIKSDKILEIISSAITSPTVVLSKKDDDKNNIGIPQGLAISNILAAIYLKNIDKHLEQIPDIEAYRYVDDILILCNDNNSDDISKDVIRRFKKIGLKIHSPETSPEKSRIDAISNGFDYLGYSFQENKISARSVSVDRLKSSLAGIFTSYHHSKKPDTKILEWRINLRITGCIFENKCKGWLFFFSEINDTSLLCSLDKYISNLCTRFGVVINHKKFIRTYHEIKHNKYRNNYIPNFDSYSTDQMKETLINYFKYNTETLTNDEITYHFHKKIGAQVKELEIDVKDFS